MRATLTGWGRVLTFILLLVLVVVKMSVTASQSNSASANRGVADLLAGRFRWKVSQPLVSPVERPEDPCCSVKDPSVVFYDGRWHLFCTIRSEKRTHQIEYLSFADWKDANAARRHVLKMHPGYFCAPQVFYFAPHNKWYLICQASDDAWQPKYQAAYATTTDIADPNSWSPLTPLGAQQADGKSGLDFWVLCDDDKAHLFFTTLDGRMWREKTRLADFPKGWSKPALAIRGDVFEASHTYRLKGMDKYLTLIEAQGGQGWRYYKAYLADRLDGEWTSLAATKDKCFASMSNAEPTGSRWTDCISHGELLRAGYDQRLEVDPNNLRFLFQGVTDAARAGKPYGQIPWRLGLLEPAGATAEQPTEKASGILFSEGFDDSRLLQRGWYDGDRFTISEKQPYSGKGCIEYHWNANTTTPASSSGIRHLFEPTDTIYLRFYIRLSKGWGWSGRPYHPHLMHFMTTENDKFRGPAASHLTVYIEPQNGKLRLAAQDIQNKDAPHGLTQGPLQGGYNGKFYDSQEVLFNDDRWHCVEAMFQLNSLDLKADKPNADGIVRGWFDGKLVIDRTDVVLRSTDFPKMKFNQFLLTPYFGPGLLPHEQTLWIDELTVGTKRLSPVKAR